MNILEQIIQMKNEGVEDEEVVRKLQEQGVSPREISSALNKVQIKNAVAGNEEMEQSIMPPPPQRNVVQKTQEIEPESPYPVYEQEEQPQEYSQPSYESYYNESGTNEVIEVAEQVFSEKMRKTQKQLEEMQEFKTRIEDIGERIKRMESIIDKLQISILDKIGSYGKNLESIKDEMSMMQDSFGKIINPFLDSTENIKKVSVEKNPIEKISGKKRTRK